jgi:predicted metal-dependent hydrolase
VAISGIDPVIIRARRKTIALIITREGKLVVRAPLRASRQQIDEIIHLKSGWIEKKQKAALDRLLQVERHTFAQEENFLFLGQPYPLQWVDRARPLLALEDGRFLLSQAANPHASDVFVAWYRVEARRILSERITLYENQTGLNHQSLRISSAHTRWGSCSSRGTLSFPWRLVMAPLPVIDYVVVHELAHLVEPNHSRRFWLKVESIMPDYREKLTWLKANNQLLTTFPSTNT